MASLMSQTITAIPTITSLMSRISQLPDPSWRSASRQSKVMPNQEMHNAEVPQPNYQIQNEQQLKSEHEIENAEMCGNCGNTSMCATRCHSCSSTVCNMCMAKGEGCCIECVKTFPVFQCMSASFSAMPSATGDSLIAWLTSLANSNKASPAHMAQKQRIDLNECVTRNACHVPDACSGPTLLDVIKDSASESTALSWADMSESEGSVVSSEPVTTMMICNIPCRFGQADVVEAIHSVGFAGMYDFVYLPSRSGKHNTNIGYAFVEFRSAQNAELFAQAFENFQFQGTKSSKTCTVKNAHHQGFNAAPSRRSK